MAHKLPETCEMWIHESIQAGLESGMSLSAIGREISDEIARKFEVYVSPQTLKTRAFRERKKTVSNETNITITPQDVSDIPKRPRHNEKYPAPPSKPVFNETNENIEWARWTWNPVTGCLHNCDYCYARDIANRFYKEKFKPTFHHHRLQAPFNTRLPDNTEHGNRNVFVCSMADLFGTWVKQEWIDKIIDVVATTPQWNYLFLTKNPSRLGSIKFPDNAWVGATVDTQIRVEDTLNAFATIQAKVKFLSCEPLLEEIIIPDLSNIDWIIIGSKSVNGRWEQPEWAWVEILLNQARKFGCMVYFKPNLTVRPKEYPI